jgi:dipeptidyl aminopeptidase/acylaminoacyl peptidase
MSNDKDFARQLCNLEIPNAIQISPDGSQVLYTTTLAWQHRKGKHNISTIWLATTDEENSAQKQLSGLFNDNSPQWHPDGRRFAFVSDRAKQGEQWAIYLQDLYDDSKPEAITPLENQQGISNITFSPDGTSIAYLSTDEKTAEQKRRVEDGEDVQVYGAELALARLRIVDIATKQVTSLSLGMHARGFSWSPDGSKLVITCSKRPEFESPFLTGTTVSVIDAKLQDINELCQFPTYLDHITWAQDDKIYFAGGTPAVNWFSGVAVYSLNSSSEAGGYEKVAFGEVNDVVGIVQRNGNLAVRLEHGLESRISWLSGETLYSRWEELDAFDIAFMEDGPIVAVATSNVNQPSELYTITGNNKPVQLSNHGEDIKTRPFGMCTYLTCPSLDKGVSLHSVFLAPTGSMTESRTGRTAKHPLPTVVLIHGGPTTRLTNAFDGFYFYWAPYLLSRGYAILLPNYRGSKGWGEKFGSHNIGGVGKEDVNDIVAATQYAIEMGYADKERLIVGGWSHGGLLTNLCSVRNGMHPYGWKFKAAISGASEADIDSMALTGSEGSAYQVTLHEDRAPWNTDPSDTRNRRGSALWGFKKAVDESNSTGKMVIPPILILHGSEDGPCHVSNAWGLRRALEYHDLPFEMRIYPRQGHVFQEQSFWVDMLLRVGEWCEKYLGKGWQQ